ncbi:factor-independent urate hydroxylase [Streptomonospora wellingtoniae]|uniref:Uricase n=1 Tax=Streptomonospora wellingtoniae TaxID=3075544 RepID=A0ABU2KS38_9ACTN|nr:urate oxidase [Streptomonospora sp. DSM 45055]MDT0302104.1 urate oxidase [Streptomonospora sp. DSM 45055]
MGIRLGRNEYGKAEVRLVHVDRSASVHRIKDLNVSTRLRGDMEAVHTRGDNTNCLTTDTQKNTVYALAREHGVGAAEEFGLLLARHFTGEHASVHGAAVELQEFAWQRIPTSEGPHGHAFVRSGAETRTVVVTADRGGEWVVSGFEGLTVLKSADSEFRGFPRTRFTTLAETGDRILATDVTARWRYAAGWNAPGSAPEEAPEAVGWDAAYERVKGLVLEAFATTPSLALQQSLYAMGEAVLRERPDIAEIRFSMPNNHHFAVDLAPFGMDNPNVVFHAADRPYGRIEAAVERDDAPDAGPAWDSVPGFV